MAVKIGSARIDENGHTTGGRAGDQTGKEVSTQNWYAHSKGWRVFRCNDPLKADKIAEAMDKACKNDRIGYNQNQRSLLYSMVKNKGFDPEKCSDSSNTDCSALVRVCCAYAGIMLSDFNTETEASRLLKSGEFTELTASKITRSSDYLRRGDILVTKTKGHTVVVLTNGSKCEDPIVEKVYQLGDRIIKNGMEGEDVRQLQSILIQLDYDCGRWGADGDYGDASELAVRSFQKDEHISVDGEVGPITVEKLYARIGEEDIQTGKVIQIFGGNCYVRDEPSTNGMKLAVARNGEKYELISTSESGWYKIAYDNDISGWVSGKYSRVIY